MDDAVAIAAAKPGFANFQEVVHHFALSAMNVYT
jgi:hypothetical protein